MLGYTYDEVVRINKNLGIAAFDIKGGQGTFGTDAIEEAQNLIEGLLSEGYFD